ncbi:MAG: 4-alpha-glucanotransferase, partial [Deltaproteobacteria bacterium]|nr:4-alpha-glucanotransferase [Deltaproteobacteria bacterium]
MNPLRRSGILLPLFSLPSGFGIGDLGSEAYRFADFLAAAGQGIWQVLPLHPTDPIHGHAPYSSASAFAGNPLLVSPERLLREGLLHESDLDDRPSFPAGRVDYPGATAFKERLLGLAWRRFKRRSSRMAEPEWELFCREHASWLDDHALFRALKARFGGAPWHLWPRPLRDRQTEALR